MSDAKERLLLIKYGEIHLKGGNRPYFKRLLLKRLRDRVKEFDASVFEQAARVYITDYPPHLEMQVIDAARKTFGVVAVCPAIKVEKDMDAIKKAAAEELNRALQESGGSTFKVKARRQDKLFLPQSDGINREVGAYILQHVEHVSVDVHNPQHYIEVEIRDMAYVYAAEFRAVGGMPVGSAGRGMLMLSGGIDSPVAAYMMAKRGLSVAGVHFLSPPYTGEAAKQKVISLAERLSLYTGAMKLQLVHFTEIQEQIYELCSDEYLTIVMRRMMMKIMQELAKKDGAKAIITGESLGQVASQTLEALTVTDKATDYLVMRPLLGFDKYEIIDIAKEIETYDISTLPGEDCCTVFVPKHPILKPKIENVIYEEEKLDINALIARAVEKTETQIIKA